MPSYVVNLNQRNCSAHANIVPPESVQLKAMTCWLLAFALVSFLECAYAKEGDGFNPQSATAVMNKSQPDSAVWVGKIKANRILFLGNSITRHVPSSAIGWSGEWGMAASSEDKDFVHVLVNRIAAMAGNEPVVMIKTIAAYEWNYDTYDVDSQLKEQIAFKADLLVLAIGENMKTPSTEDAKKLLKTSVVRLLTAFKSSNPMVVVVRSCFWSSPEKDEVLAQASKETGCIFVDISDLGKNELNFARSERKYAHDGVANHPGDKGMQSIADAIVNALLSVR